MTISNKMKIRIAEFMTLKEVYRQKLTSVNSYLERKVSQRLNQVIEYVSQQKNQIDSYKKQIKFKTTSLCTDMFNATHFTFKLMFARPRKTYYTSTPFDIGALCI